MKDQDQICLDLIREYKANGKFTYESQLLLIAAVGIADASRITNSIIDIHSK